MYEYMYMTYVYSSTLVHIQQYSTVLYIYWYYTYTNVRIRYTAVFWCIYTVYKYRLYTVVLIILNAATTVTANNQFNNHDQNLGGGKSIYFAYLQKTVGHVPPRALHTSRPCTWRPLLVLK